MPARLEILPPPVDSRIEVLEMTPDVLEVLLRPPGWNRLMWKRLMTWGLAVRFALLVGLGVYLAVPLTNIALNNSSDVSAIDLLFPAGLGCLYLGVLAFYAWDCYRQAEEWTILRIAGRQVRLTHPRPLRDDKHLEVSIKRAEKFPTERYSTRHQLLLRTGKKRNILCFTPLEYPDAHWLIDEINRRIAAPEEDHAGPS